MNTDEEFQQVCEQFLQESGRVRWKCVHAWRVEANRMLHCIFNDENERQHDVFVPLREARDAAGLKEALARRLA